MYLVTLIICLFSNSQQIIDKIGVEGTLVCLWPYRPVNFKLLVCQSSFQQIVDKIGLEAVLGKLMRNVNFIKS